MSTQQEMPPKPQMRRWVRVLLIGSLTVNLLVVGLAAGAAWRFRDHAEMRPAPSVGAMIYREMSREDRRELRKHVWGERGDRGAFKQKRLSDGLAVTEALRRTPFDRAALSELLTAQLRERESFQIGIQDKWIDRISTMTDAERAAYADRLEHRIKKGGHRRH